MRIAKYISHCGYCSRRKAEGLITSGQVVVNGAVVTDLSTQIQDTDILCLNGIVLKPTIARIWLYHKAVGSVTTHNDPQGRPTVFEQLPAKMPHVISVGRLDLNSEGLLVLTNLGTIARYFELPSNGFVRNYRVRAYGKCILPEVKSKNYIIDEQGEKLEWESLTKEQRSGQNGWYNISLRQGKNREIRRIFEYFGLQVNRLIRLSYGPFTLGSLAKGKVQEVEPNIVQEIIQQIGND